MWKLIELCILFLGVPLLLKFTEIRLFLVLFVVGSIILVYLLRNKHVTSLPLFSLRGLEVVLLRFVTIALVLSIFTALFFPDLLFIILRERFFIWPFIMVFYPIFSVLPQTLIYRLFFVERYGNLFKSKRNRIMAGAALFSFGHLLFGNAIALLFTFVGGMLFMRTYEKHKSFFLSFIEHSLYGCFIFTIGLGQFFYTGFSG